jgi:hypothetical protein
MMTDAESLYPWAYYIRGNFPSVYGLGKSVPRKILETWESRPCRAHPILWYCNPGLTRPGLSNLAPLGLTRDFVAQTLP